MTTENNEEYRYRAWFIPNPPGPAFTVEVDTLEQAALASAVLAQYSLYLGSEDVIPVSAGGVEIRDGAEWNDVELEWSDEEADFFDAADERFSCATNTVKR